MMNLSIRKGLLLPPVMARHFAAHRLDVGVQVFSRDVLASQASWTTGRPSHNGIFQPSGCHCYDAIPSVRFFSSSRRRRKKLKPEEDPFFVLGFTKTPEGRTNRVILHSEKHHHHHHHHASPKIPFRKVKARFLQIAMKHHPDTSQASTKEEQQSDRDIFVKARMAFEALVEAHDGMAMLRSESDEHSSDDGHDEHDFTEWFKQQTGHAMPFMDLATMKEVAEMTEKVGGEAGLDRDGGMWTLARMVSQSVKSGGGGADSLLQLEAGTSKLNREINGILRRRRRR